MPIRAPSQVPQESKRLRRVILGAAGLLALFIVLAAPVGYLVTQWRAEVDRMHTDATRVADSVARFAYLEGNLWSVQKDRLEQILKSHTRFQNREGPHSVWILDSEGRTAADSLQGLAWPSRTVEVPIRVGTGSVGCVVLEQSFRPPFVAAVWVFLLASAFSAILYFVVGQIPVGALDSAFARLSDVEEKLRARVLELEASDRKTAEAVAARERTEALLVRSMDAMPAVLALYGADDRLIFCNGLYRELYDTEAVQAVPGVRFEDVARAYAGQAWIGRSPGEAEAWLANRLARRRSPARSFEFQRADGQWMEVSDYIFADGRLLVVGLVVTERVEMQESLRQMQKMEAVGQLTAGIAHDFNNLLAVIVGTLDLVADCSVIPPDHRHRIERALAAAERGAKLTDHLLSYACRQHLRPDFVNANTVIGELEPMLARTLGESIRIVAFPSSDLWDCRVDRGQLENALINLGINARDAMPNGGTISISTRNVAVTAEDARARNVAPGNYVMISVADTGTGMSPEILERVFEPFFTTKEFGRGSGLGLSMVYGFVNQSGGHVRIDSAPGRGTTVRLYLAQAPRQAAQAGKGDDANLRQGYGQSVLVVEDNAEVREMTCSVLRSLGYQTVQARDAAMALTVLAARRDVEVLLTDIVMPGGMNGFELAREAKERFPDIKVVFTSGAPGTALRSENYGWPDAEILPKPFKKTALAARMAALFGYRAAADEEPSGARSPDQRPNTVIGFPRRSG